MNRSLPLASKVTRSSQLIEQSRRCFAAKGGPPGQAETIFPYKRGPTTLQKMVEDGQEFVMGPPPGLEKTYGAHRDAI